MTPKQIAKAILELYDGDARRWTKGVYARNKDGGAVDAKDKDAVCWCLIGAAWRIGERGGDKVNAALDAIKALTPAKFVDDFNDARGTTFADVERVLKQIADEPEVKT